MKKYLKWPIINNSFRIFCQNISHMFAIKVSLIGISCGNLRFLCDTAFPRQCFKKEESWGWGQLIRNV